MSAIAPPCSLKSVFAYECYCSLKVACSCGNWSVVNAQLKWKTIDALSTSTGNSSSSTEQLPKYSHRQNSFLSFKSNEVVQTNIFVHGFLKVHAYSQTLIPNQHRKSAQHNNYKSEKKISRGQLLRWWCCSFKCQQYM